MITTNTQQWWDKLTSKDKMRLLVKFDTHGMLHPSVDDLQHMHDNAKIMGCIVTNLLSGNITECTAGMVNDDDYEFLSYFPEILARPL